MKCRCGSRLLVYKTVSKGDHVVIRYRHCPHCGHKTITCETIRKEEG